MTPEERDALLPGEEHLPDGHKSGFVAVIGLPNSGKSTLLNAFLQQKIAIVSPRPQTTRQKQLGILTTRTYQMIFVDTPGLIKEPRHMLDAFMLDAATETLGDADVILWVADASTPPNNGDQAIAAQLKALSGAVTAILALNKNDLIAPDEVIERTEAYRNLLPEAPWLLLSALHDRGTEELLGVIADHLPEGPRYYPADQVTDAYLRDIAAELIREQAMLQLREEVPYGVAVQVDEFKEREHDVTYIAATIYVERAAHKRIVIGSKGSQLRRIGAAARAEIEALLDGKVFLDLWVKVQPNWRRDERALQRLGYTKRD
jgi:GTP-binding protein Era